MSELTLTEKTSRQSWGFHELVWITSRLNSSASLFYIDSAYTDSYISEQKGLELKVNKFFVNGRTGSVIENI